MTHGIPSIRFGAIALLVLAATFGVARGDGFPIASSGGGAVNPIDAVKASSGSVYALLDVNGAHTFPPGTLSLTTTQNTVVIVKYDSGGTAQWYKAASGLTFGTALDIDEDENVYVLGRTGGATTLGTTPVPANRGFVTSLTPAGNWRWVQTVHHTGGGALAPVDLVVRRGDPLNIPPLETAVFVAGTAACGDVEFSGAGVATGTGSCNFALPPAFNGAAAITNSASWPSYNDCDSIIWPLTLGGCSGQTNEYRGDGSWFGRLDPQQGDWDWIDLQHGVGQLTRFQICTNVGVNAEFPNILCDAVTLQVVGLAPIDEAVTGLALDGAGGIYYTIEQSQSASCPDPAAVFSDRIGGNPPNDGLGTYFNRNVCTNGAALGVEIGCTFVDSCSGNVILGGTATELRRIDESQASPVDPIVPSATDLLDVTNTLGAGVAPRNIGASDGSIFIVGSQAGATLKVAKLSDNGSTVSVSWTESSGTASSIQADDLVVVGSDAGPATLYVTGQFSGSLTAGGTTLGPSSGNDIFVSQLLDQGIAGSWGWSVSAGGAGSDTGRALSVDAGSATLLSTIAGVAQFGADPVGTAGQQGAALAQLRATNGEWLVLTDFIVGDRVAPPLGAVSNGATPQVFVNGALDSAGDVHFWSPKEANGDGEGRLYMTQSTGFVEIRWPTSTAIDAIANNQITTSLGRAVWPPNAVIQLGAEQADGTFVSAPIEINPVNPPTDLTYVEVLNPNGNSSEADAPNGVYTAQNTGYSVIKYAVGTEANLATNPVRFQVVRTRNYKALNPPVEACTIGTKLAPPAGSEPGRPGWTLLDNALYDGFGDDAAYSRDDRTGVIIPVNRVSTARQSPTCVPGAPCSFPDSFKTMAVAWYAEQAGNDIGVFWPSVPKVYNCNWPAATSSNTIVISSERGSGPLDPALYPQMRIYNQPDVAEPGYNPNDEFAMFRPSKPASGFNALYALRSDFGSALSPPAPKDASDPYALLKYFDQTASEWVFKVFKVVPTDGSYPNFTRDNICSASGDLCNTNADCPLVPNEVNECGPVPVCSGIDNCLAGVIKPYYPLSTLGVCAETTIDGELPGDLQPPPPFFRDVNSVLWPRSAGNGAIQWWYPLQPDFFYDLDSNDQPDDVAPTNGCVPFLARYTSTGGGGTADPATAANTTYSFDWPALSDAPLLTVGETLYAPAKFGLPEIATQAAAEVVFDELQQSTLDADEYDPTKTLVRMFNPLWPHEVELAPADYDVLGELTVELVEGGEYAIRASGDETRRLSPSLTQRIRYDILAAKLKFQGVGGSGSDIDPLLATNVMSDRDREHLKLLDDGQLVANPWDDAIDALYALSRNPNQPALFDPDDCTVDQAGSQPAVRRCDCVTAGDIAGLTPPETCQTATWDDLRTWDPTAEGDSMIGLQDRDNDGVVDPARVVGGGAALTAGFAQGEGWVTLAFNNDPSVSSPVSVEVIRVGCLSISRCSTSGDLCDIDGDCDVAETCELERTAPYQGQVFVIEPENLFEESVTLRHSGDFAGQTDSLDFEWYYQEDSTGLAPDPPTDFGNVFPWVPVGPEFISPSPNGPSAPNGANEITVGGSNVQVLADGWYFSRYKGLPVCNNETDYGLLAGQPAGTPANELAQLAEGWVKRVIGNLNQYEARVKQFHKSPTNTYASMITQLGKRFEGSIALNNDPDYLNSVGLIQAYETVARRAMALSVNAIPPVESAGANNAILLAFTRLSDFYTLLGNEAFSDAIDPTIGFSTEDTEIGLGALAPTIFAFQEQLPSLLDEEITMLRGRTDDTGATNGPPVYNRLFWNFTGGYGEAAYAQTYNMSDVDNSGVIDEDDAGIFFPQGHGDAWGHYLTALQKHYELLRHPIFNWTPRIESVRVGTTPVPVDYQDERRFAEAAERRARAGTEIVDLTYRQNFVEDVEGQWQGYKDIQPDRAWGVDGWGRRAGMGSYFDWLTANAILPTVDPKSCEVVPSDPDCHVGIQVIERDQVEALASIPTQHAATQTLVDQADRGLNPLGLAKGVVPFDIDPARVDDGETHFEQVYSRATAAIENGSTVWNVANQLTRQLRRNQDTLADFQTNVIETEQDFQSRLIELFGTPYPEDIGPGGVYPAGYSRWDLYHFLYIDLAEFAGLRFDTALASPNFKTFDATFAPMPNGLEFFGALESSTCGGDPFAEGCALGTRPLGTGLTIPYTTWESPEFGQVIVKPPEWSGKRRVTGTIQLALQDMAQASLSLRQGIEEYNLLAAEAQCALGTLIDFFKVNEAKLRINNNARVETNRLLASITAMNAASTALERTADVVSNIAEVGSECLPKVFGLANDVTSFARCSVRLVGLNAGIALGYSADGLAIVASSLEASVEDVSLQAAIDIELLESRLELASLEFELEAIMRQEPLLRTEMLQRAQQVVQAGQAYRNALAEGNRVMEELVNFRKSSAAAVQEARYEDLTFRIFRNDALQKYLAQLEIAARFTYLAATAYDYDTNLLGSNTQSGEAFLQNIVRQRNLGQMQFGQAIPGSAGLADPLGRMQQNFDVLKGQMGFNNPQLETNRFSMRREHFDIDDPGAAGDTAWRDELRQYTVPNLWDVPEFRRYARPFAPEIPNEPQPGLVIPFDSTVTFGLNFFGEELEAQDSAYSAANYSTRIRSVGVWLEGYELLPLSNTPRVYLVPVGADVLRAAEATNFEVREWSVVDQVLPIPFPIGAGDLSDPNWIPGADTLSDTFGEIRRYSDFRAYPFDDTLEVDEFTTDSRLVGRSVWNRRWLLIIPGGNLLFDPQVGIDTLVDGDGVPGSTPGGQDGDGISDIHLFFQTYAYSGS